MAPRSLPASHRGRAARLSTAFPSTTPSRRQFPRQRRTRRRSSPIDILRRFEADDETELVVMVGEIGGNEEEKAARFIEAELSKPVVAYIAGFTAPPGKAMGHAGAIISGSSGTAQAKKDALEASGIQVGSTPTEVAGLAVEARRAVA